MPLLAFPFRYRSEDGYDPAVSPSVLADPANAAPGALDPSQVSQAPSPLPPKPQPIPKPPRLNDTAAGASLAKLPPLNPDAGRNGNYSGLAKVATMPPPGEPAPSPAPAPAPSPAPPLAAPGAAPASPSASAAAIAPTAPPTGPPPPDLADALQPKAADSRSAADKLTALHGQRPEAPSSNWAQRIALAIMAVSPRLANVANQIVHPKYSEQMRAYQGTLADTEAQQKEEETQASTEANVAAKEGQGAYKQAQAAVQQGLAQTKKDNEEDRAYKGFVESMGPGAVQQGPNDPVPPGYHAFADPKYPDRVWIRQQSFLPVPKDLLPLLPGAKEGDQIPNAQFNEAVKAYQQFQLQQLKDSDKPDPKVDPNRWIVDANNPDPAISGPAQANLKREAIQKQAGRPVFNMPGSEDAPSSIAQAIAEYQQSFPTVRTTSPQAMAQADALMRQIKAINPDYHQEYYNTFQKTENDATTGKLATSANSFNTMIGHLTLLEKAADALKNNNIQVLNSIANQWGIQTGQDPVTIFQTIVHRVGPETARAYIGAGGDVSDRQKMEDDFSKNTSPDQIHSAIRTAALLGKGKMDENINQYMRGTYGRGKQQLLSKEAAESLQRIAGPAANGVVVKVKGKGPVTFPNQAAADGFRKEHPDKVDK